MESVEGRVVVSHEADREAVGHEPSAAVLLLSLGHLPDSLLQVLE